MNIHQHEYSANIVSVATGVPLATLQAWLKRGKIVGHPLNPIAGGGGSGVHRRFSFHNVIEIGIAKALLDAGLGSVDSAFRAASAFAHIGNGPLPNIQPRRDPGFPFDTASIAGRTLLWVSGDRSTIEFIKPNEDSFTTLRADLLDREGFVVLQVDKVFARIVTALGYHPQAILDDEYGHPRTDH